MYDGLSNEEEDALFEAIENVICPDIEEEDHSESCRLFCMSIKTVEESN
jgi:hypothetical protein